MEVEFRIRGNIRPFLKGCGKAYYEGIAREFWAFRGFRGCFAAFLDKVLGFRACRFYRV